MLLRRRGLNQQYKGINFYIIKGGLSSFCTILLVLSFVEYYNQINPKAKLGRILLEMLKYYGSEFDPHIKGIWFLGYG